MLIRTASRVAGAVLLGLGALHLVWLWSPWPFDSPQELLVKAVGTTQPERAPTPFLTLLVALGLVVSGLATLVAGGERPPRAARVLVAITSVVMTLRGVVGLGVSTLTELSTPEFARLDQLLYSPLTLALGALWGVVAWRHSQTAPDRT